MNESVELCLSCNKIVDRKEWRGTVDEVSHPTKDPDRPNGLVRLGAVHAPFCEVSVECPSCWRRITSQLKVSPDVIVREGLLFPSTDTSVEVHDEVECEAFRRYHRSDEVDEYSKTLTTSLHVELRARICAGLCVCNRPSCGGRFCTRARIARSLRDGVAAQLEHMHHVWATWKPSKMGLLDANEAEEIRGKLYQLLVVTAYLARATEALANQGPPASKVTRLRTPATVAPVMPPFEPTNKSTAYFRVGDRVRLSGTSLLAIPWLLRIFAAGRRGRVVNIDGDRVVVHWNNGGEYDGPSFDAFERV